MIISYENVRQFAESMRKKGRAESTINKYNYEIVRFVDFIGNQELTQGVLDYFYNHMLKTRKTPHSQNRVSSIINIFLAFLGINDMRLAMAKYDSHKLYSKKEKDLTFLELKQMIDYAVSCDKIRTALVMQTFAYTGIRVQELKFITVETLRNGSVDIPQRGMSHRVVLPEIIRERLLTYAQSQGILTGPVFITRNGTPCVERNVTTDIQRMAKEVGIPSGKANPTAIRRLFARTYFSKYGDLAGLTDLLGIKNMDATVLYVKDNITE